MTKKAVLTLAAGLIVNSFAGCHSRDPAPLTRTQLLADKKWYVQSYVIATPAGPAQDIYPLISACKQDDFEQFLLPGTLSYNEGLTKCDATASQTQPGTWTLSTHDSQLTITLDGRTVIYIIAELTSNSLRLKSSESNAKGEVVTYDITLIAK